MDVSEARLRFFAQQNQYIWEIIGGGPLGWNALNPQPLPPQAIGAAFVSILAERASIAGSFSQFADEVDVWCLTGHPRHIPKPKGTGPDPLPWQVFLGAAVAAVELAHGLEAEDAEQVGGAAQQLFRQAQQMDSSM
ncbi:hypothetical protein GCM10023171_05760 [Microbacterium panaciterrae]|uniref:Uncharacterized protein n=2 Tax=Microbacterium panaciterrae TaxID=985759 RepID=A0ABP8P4P1_9MICO